MRFSIEFVSLIVKIQRSQPVTDSPLFVNKGSDTGSDSRNGYAWFGFKPY